MDESLVEIWVGNFTDWVKATEMQKAFSIMPWLFVAKPTHRQLTWGQLKLLQMRNRQLGWMINYEPSLLKSEIYCKLHHLGTECWTCQPSPRQTLKEDSECPGRWWLVMSSRDDSWCSQLHKRHVSWSTHCLHLELLAHAMLFWYVETCICIGGHP